MINDIFRLDDNVPRVYVTESRDFQVLTRLVTYALNCCKYDVESLKFLNSGMLTNDRLLSNLCEKPGFMDGDSITGEYLRYITENFGKLVRDKGTEIGILNAVYLYLLSQNYGTTVFVNCDKSDYTVHIGIKSTVKDISVLYTILKYIIPTGWLIDIYFYTELKVNQGLSYKDTFINMIKKASAKNALYIIRTNNSNIPAGAPDYDIAEQVSGTPYERYETFRNNTHITKYTGGLVIDGMTSIEIESFANEPERLMQYGVELWDARGNIRTNSEVQNG